jgi:GNAT superfamily N-acetyltransferase
VFRPRHCRVIVLGRSDGGQAVTEMKNIDIRFEDDPNGAMADKIECRLIDALRQNVPPSDLQPLTVLARDGATIIGGLVGSTSYGWLLVKMLWVAEEMRGGRIGTHLMAEAERLARSRGCHAAWLDTSSADAARFYLRLGYESFGVLENALGEQPQGHHRCFLSKRLR